MGYIPCLSNPPLKHENGKKCVSLTISEHNLPNSSKKPSVVISPLINLIQGPLSPSLIKAFSIVPEGIWFCTSHSVGHNNTHQIRNNNKWLRIPGVTAQILWHHWRLQGLLGRLHCRSDIKRRDSWTGHSASHGPFPLSLELPAEASKGHQVLSVAGVTGSCEPWGWELNSSPLQKR